MATKLWEALDIMRDGGHTKGVWYDGSSHCLVGAVSKAHRGIDQAMALDRQPTAMPGDLDSLAMVARELFPERIKYSRESWSILAEFNDDRSTTVDDAALVLEKAAIRSDEILSS